MNIQFEGCKSPSPVIDQASLHVFIRDCGFIVTRALMDGSMSVVTYIGNSQFPPDIVLSSLKHLILDG